MTLDIVIPCHNEEDNLKSLLPYLFRLDKNNCISYFIIDSNESNDNTKIVCKEYKLPYIKSKFTQRAKQMNEGAKLGNGDVILFLHADVLPPESFYEEIKLSIGNGNEAGIFAYQFVSDCKMLKINSWFTKHNNFFSGGGDQCQFYKRDLFNQLGTYDTAAVIMEDFYLWDKMKRAGAQYSIIKNKARVSARKYALNNWLSVNLVSLIVFVFYWCGVKPTSLKKIYSSLLN